MGMCESGHSVEARGQFFPFSVWVQVWRLDPYLPSHLNVSLCSCLSVSLLPSPLFPSFSFCLSGDKVSCSSGWSPNLQCIQSRPGPLHPPVSLSLMLVSLAMATTHSFLTLGPLLSTPACRVPERGPLQPRPPARGAARRMQHTAPFMGRRQRAASLTLRGKFAGGRRGGVAGRWRRESRGLLSTGWPAQPLSE